MLCLLTGFPYLHVPSQSFNFIFYKFLQIFNGGMCSESEFVLVVGIHFFNPDMTLHGWLDVKHQVSVYLETNGVRQSCLFWQTPNTRLRQRCSHPANFQHVRHSLSLETSAMRQSCLFFSNTKHSSETALTQSSLSFKTSDTRLKKSLPQSSL